MSTSSAGGVAVVSAGNFAVTLVIAAFAAALSTVVYVANKRRTSDSHLSGQKASLRGRRSAVEQHGAAEHLNSTRTDGTHNDAKNTTTSRPKSYYALRAEHHVSQYSTALVEWRDDVMGVRFFFSPILFAVETEERQAPLVFVSLRYLRQPDHCVTVIIEACATALTAEEYRENSVKRIHDCVSLLATNTTRIGVALYPHAEYCYMDERNKVRYALSVFLTHDRLAVTVQYVADTRVKGVLPTAFNELVRSVHFVPPRPSTSYLLCVEPRLGLGFRLPLDFVMVPQLQNTLAVPSDLLATGCWAGGESGNSNCCNSRSGSCAEVHGASSFDCLLGSSSSLNPQEFNVDGVIDASCSTPYAAVAGFGSRKILVVACYEPLTRRRVSFQQLFERLLHTTLLRFSVIQNDREAEPVTVVWCAEDKTLQQEKLDRSNTFVVRPQRLVVSINGDSAVDDDTGSTLLLEGAFCVQKVALDAKGPCVAFLRDALQLQQHKEEEEGDGLYVERKSGEYIAKQNNGKECALDAAIVSAYLSVFCLHSRDQCVSISFLSFTTQHTLEEFITFCRRTIDTVSVGNHFGQGTLIIYCNRRHEVRPFRILLDAANAAAEGFVFVEEPLIGDPLAVFNVGGFEKVKVFLRVFPCLSASSTSLQSQRRAMERLEKTVRGYLKQLPDRVSVHHWEVTTLGSRAALEIHYERLVDDDGGGGSKAEGFNADGGLGRINPFALYCETMPSLSPAFVAGTGAEAARQATPQQLRSSAAGRALTTSCSADSLLRCSSSRGSSSAAAASMHVTVVVCCEGCAFMFLGVCTEYSFNAVRRAVRQLAAKVSVLTGAAT